MSKQDIEDLIDRQALIERQTLNEIASNVYRIQRIVESKISQSCKMTSKKRLRLRESRKPRKYKFSGRRR